MDYFPKGGSNMRRIVFTLISIFIISLIAVGCGEKTQENELGTEFLLPIGEEAVIKGENLKISFEEVLEDSRCPKNVECVWAGRARYAVQLTRDDESELAELTEPGETGQGSVVFLDYQVTANLEPYPEDPDSIKTEDYYLRMSVKKTASSAYGLEEQADIYAAVIRQLYEEDHTFGENRPDFPNLYIVYRTDDTVGGEFGGAPASRILTKPLRDAIEDRLSDMPAEIKWAGSFDAVPLEDNSTVEGGGVIVRVGNINGGKEGTVEVAGSIYIANLAAGGQTYVLEKKYGTWQITGTTGPVWIS
jgi:hypothetical protein